MVPSGYENVGPPHHSKCRYSSEITCQTDTFFAYAAYNYVVLMDPGQLSVVAVLLGHGNKVTCLAASRSGEQGGSGVILSGSRDKSVVAWSVARRAVIRKRQKLDDEVVALATVHGAEALVVIACKNGALRSWNWDIGAATPLPNVDKNRLYCHHSKRSTTQQLTGSACSILCVF